MTRSSESEDKILIDSDNEYDEFDFAKGNQDCSSADHWNAYENIDDDDRIFELEKDEETLWTNKPARSKISRNSSLNVITHLSGQKGDARGVVDGVKLFSLF